MKHISHHSTSHQHTGLLGSSWIYGVILILAIILLVLLAAEAYICISQYLQLTDFFPISSTAAIWANKGGDLL